MKQLVAFFVVYTNVVVFASSESIKNFSAYNYHVNYGIPRARELKTAEETQVVGQIGKIAGGSITDISEVPYQVGLVIELWWVITSVCGGSVISPTRVLTAAHCYWDGNMIATAMTVVLGSNTLFSGGLRIPTTDINMHPQWNHVFLANDIAVIRVPAVTYTNLIQPIALPSGEELSNDFSGRTGLASGFGATGDDASIVQTQVISSVHLDIIPNAVCTAVYGPEYVRVTNLCTSGAGGRSTCGGDSGGPLVVESNGRKIQVGVTSYGHRDGCQLNYPAGFARVSSFIDWIWSI